MKQLRYTSVLVLLMLAHYAHGDSVTTFVAQATITFGPGEGGDNMSATFGGPGVSLFASGGLSCSPSTFWCDQLSFPLAPGSSLRPTAFLSFVSATGRVTFGGQSQICGVDCGISGTDIVALSSFRFPSNGQPTFTVTLPAVITPAIIGALGSGSSFQQFAVQVPQGRLVLTFDFVRAQGLAPAYYSFDHGFFTTTPEPGTLGLMGLGFAGIAGVILKKRLQAR